MKLVVGDFSEILGCFVLGEDYTHIGMLFVRVTACGKSMGDTILSREVEITCPECEAELKYRQEHPEARVREFGIVTHKET